MFVPYTRGSGLAKQVGDAEEKMESRTGYKIKIVERSGTTLMDILHKSKPWKGMDCGQEGCMLCWTMQAELSLFITCQAKEEKEIEKEFNGDAAK